MKNEIEIPEGCEAKIVGNKVIFVSKDEKIREAISYAIGTAKHQDGTLINGVTEDEAVAYLEKQKDEAQKQFNLGIQAGKEEAMYEMEKNQKPAEWSEDDKLHLNNAILAAEKEWGTESRTAKFLKSLRPQSNQEWSEEDERIMDHCIGYINASCLDANDLYKCIDWLESLHRRMKSPNNWKPREEHFQGLRRAIKNAEKGSDAWNALTDLYADLQKLL